MTTDLRDYLTLPYAELEERNLEAKEQRQKRTPMHKLQELRLKYLTDEKRIKAVTVLFSDLEGRLHMLDYDKKFLVKSSENLTFDGSSIRGFTAQSESDLRLFIDWGAFYWCPSDIFGAGKVLVFGQVVDKDGSPFAADMRGILDKFSTDMFEKEGYTLNAANEVEGFVFQGLDAEQRYHEEREFELVNTGGYYHSLPGDPLRHDGTELLDVVFAIVAERAHARRIEVGVERDLFDVEVAENLRQHDRRVAERVVDDDAEVRFGERACVERRRECAGIAFQRARREVEPPDFVHRRAPEVFAEEQIFDLTLGAFIDADAVGVGKLEYDRVRIVRCDAHVHAAVAACTDRKPRQRQRIRSQIEDVNADRQQAGDDAAVHHARSGMRVAARHHGLAGLERCAERLAELERELRRDLQVR